MYQTVQTLRTSASLTALHTQMCPVAVTALQNFLVVHLFCGLEALEFGSPVTGRDNLFKLI